MGVAPTWHDGKKFEPGIGFITPGYDYWYVDFGPIPNRPDWHEQSKPSSYPFPHEDAAFCFAHSHKYREPFRSVAVRSPDGAVFELGDMEYEDALH